MKPKDKKNEKVEPEDLLEIKYSALKRDFGGRKEMFRVVALLSQKSQRLPRVENGSASGRGNQVSAVAQTPDRERRTSAGATRVIFLA